MRNSLALSKKLYIVGTGGFAREVLCLLKDIYPDSTLRSWVHFLVPTGEGVEETLMGIDVVTEELFNPKEAQVIVAVGDSHLRKKIVAKFGTSVSYPTLIHPKASVSEWVDLEEGCLITAGVALTCNIKIGAHSHLNLNTTVGHDCNIGEYFTAAPGVNISGDCIFGSCVNLGTNASIKQGIEISSNVIIGMGGAVVKNIPEPGTYIGVPVKRIK